MVYFYVKHCWKKHIQHLCQEHSCAISAVNSVCTTGLFTPLTLFNFAKVELYILGWIKIEQQIIGIRDACSVVVVV